MKASMLLRRVLLDMLDEESESSTPEASMLLRRVLLDMLNEK